MTYPTKRLDEILPAEALAELQALVDTGKTTAADFKVVTRKYAMHLAAKECDPDYIAYAIEYVYTNTAFFDRGN